MTYSFKTAGWPERLWRTNNNADIARGNVPGSTPFAAFGEKVVTGSGTSILWSTGMPTTLTVPDSIQLTVVSTSASDTGSIGIRYLDGDLLERTETLTLSGTTPVTTVATDVRAINNVYSKSGPVVGNVTLTNGGVTYARIVAGRLEHTSSLQRVPANKRLMIGSLYAGSSSGSSESKVLVRLVTSFINGDSFADQGYLHTTGAVSLQDSSTTLAGFGPFPIPPGEWVGLQASWDKAADITGGFFGYLENA
jgi:hypothetical protein